MQNAMNEPDEYDFRTVDNSNLYSLFGNEGTFHIGDSNLVYKAPKQPVISEPNRKTATANKPKVYYKYINLYEVLEEEELKNLGQYVIGLVTSISNSCDVLVYQSKRNILIREPINSLVLTTHDLNNSSLSGVINEHHWVFEFNEADFEDFLSVYSENGGEIKENVKRINQTTSRLDIPHLHKDSVLLSLTFNTQSTILDPIEATGHKSVTQESTSISEKNEHVSEKKNILSRLAKMGLPQLPYFQKEEDVISDNSQLKIVPNKEVKEQNMIEGNHQVVKFTESEVVTQRPDLSENQDKLKQYIPSPYDHINSLSLLAENRFMNSEILQAISNISSKLNPGGNISCNGNGKIENQLKSKLKAYEMKCENLEDELAKIKEKYNKLKESIVFSDELKTEFKEIVKLENSSQTDKNPCVHRTNLNELLKKISFRSLETDLDILRTIQSNFEDEELNASFETAIRCIEENINQTMNDNVKVKRQNFIKDIKRIMLELYTRVSMDQNEYFKSSVASHVREATSELVKTYDTLTGAD